MGNLRQKCFLDIVTKSMTCLAKESGMELCRSCQIWMPSSTTNIVAMSGVVSSRGMLLKPKFSGTSNLDFLKENGK
jgi:hypothetical protein